ncbi:MAG: YARHG domain-containing protein [Clostridia bacterium]|nr:YARHG domain-containing protein [Clostridia bacterium]
MSNKTIRRLVGGIGTGLILLICAVIIGIFFLSGRNLQRIDVPQYVDVARGEQGEYVFTLNVDRMLYEEHLEDPPAAELDRYPEIGALRSLGLKVEKQGGDYVFSTVTYGEDPTAALKQGGIKLINTEWTWTKEQVEAHLSGTNPAPQQEAGKLDFSEYICTKQRADGSFAAELDTVKMLRDAGTDPASDSIGAQAIKSLGVSCKKTDDGYRIEATSNRQTIMEDLAAAGLRVVNTHFTWSEQEMQAHLGELTSDTPETQTPETQTPETQAPETPEAQTPGTDAPETTPPAGEGTPKPQRNPNAIVSLYGFDQTEVRKAIRAAKERYYGSRMESSEVRYNYFGVGNDSAKYGNVFRIVYAITTSTGTEYFIADVYDLELETGYKESDVYYFAATDRSTAKSTDDLRDYRIYTLNEGSMVFEENKDKSPFDKDGLVMAKSMTETLTYDELWDIPQTDDMTLLKLLGYARNEMFARGGHKFGDTSNYYKYFSRFDWYKPTGSVSADALAAKYPATQKNITTIKFLEKLIKEG